MRPTLTLLLVLLGLPACDDDAGLANGGIPDAPPSATSDASDTSPDAPSPADTAPPRDAVDAGAGAADAGEAGNKPDVGADPEVAPDAAAVLTVVIITPANPSIGPNQTYQLRATAGYHDGTIADVTSQATWTSSHPQVATVNSAGLVSTLATGNTTISVEYQGVTGSIQFTVTTIALVGIGVVPASATLARGTSRQFTAHMLFADNTTLEVTGEAQWSVEHPAIATVSNQDGQRGLVQAIAEGQTTVRAMLPSHTGTATLTVTTP